MFIIVNWWYDKSNINIVTNINGEIRKWAKESVAKEWAKKNLNGYWTIVDLNNGR